MVRRHEASLMSQKLLDSPSTRRLWLQRASALGLGYPALSALLALDTAETSAQEVSGGEWVIALTEEPTGFDAAVQTFTFSNFMVEGHIFEPLVDLQGPELEVTPILAESWTNIDETTWEFKLREGITWHNGDPLTSADVKWTIERMKEEGGGRGYMVSAFESVEAPDDLTVVIHTVGPYGPMIFQLSELVILPQKAWQEMGAEAFNTAPVGTGPYRIVEWRRGEALTLEANPDWWRGTPTPERLVFRPITDPADTRRGIALWRCGHHAKRSGRRVRGVELG